VSAAYFVPTDQEEEDLMAAARRGVDVRLLLPGDSDSPRALAVGRSHYSDLLEAGVKIYETQNVVLHSKTAVIDGVWSVVGSSNFDRRSVLFNDEVDAVVLGSATAQELQTMFENDTKDAKQIDLASWRRRSVVERVNELYSTLWQDLL
jgi:cardiolipin synthase